jgi:hypothetical protein
MPPVLAENVSINYEPIHKYEKLSGIGLREVVGGHFKQLVDVSSRRQGSLSPDLLFLIVFRLWRQGVYLKDIVPFYAERNNPRWSSAIIFQAAYNLSHRYQGISDQHLADAWWFQRSNNPRALDTYNPGSNVSLSLNRPEREARNDNIDEGEADHNPFASWPVGVRLGLGWLLVAFGVICCSRSARIFYYGGPIVLGSGLSIGAWLLSSAICLIVGLSFVFYGRYLP